MSFQEDVKRHQDALLRMVDAGVPVAAAALAVGVARGRAYELLRACGYGVGPKTVVTAEHRRRVLRGFEAAGSIRGAAPPRA